MSYKTKLLFKVSNKLAPLNRYYFTQSKQLKDCIKCAVQLSDETILCDKAGCNALQPIHNNVDYFKVFDKEPKFDIDLSSLKKDYFKKMNFYHPDKTYANNLNGKEICESSSAVLNKIYETLKDPLSRACYLLERQNIRVEEQESIDDPNLLVSIMELNEELEDANSPEDVKELIKKIKSSLQEFENEFSHLFNSSDLDGAKKLIIKYRYFSKVLKRATMTL